MHNPLANALRPFTCALALLALAACAGDASPTPPATPIPNTLHAIPDAPERDPLDVAKRLRSPDAKPLPNRVLYSGAKQGSIRTFTSFDLANNTLFEFLAEARYISKNAVWYFPPEHGPAQEEAAAIAREFEERILPGVIELIAPNLSLPGPITIVHGYFSGISGYFNSADTLPRDANPASNERASFFINLANGFGDETYYARLAHETQHLVHWTVDPTEEAWAHEALSEFAARSLGYDALPFTPYLENPNASPIDWPADHSDILPNYAGAALFIAYLAERLGPDFPARFAAQQRDGAAAVENASPSSSFTTLLADWAAANIVNASAPPYGYDALPNPATVQQMLNSPGALEIAAAQLAPAYIELQPSSPWSVALIPRRATPLLPVSAYSGETCWWSNRGNSIDSTLTREFNLPSADSPSLEFHAWWDIEENWDHAYIAASTDNGKTWTPLQGDLSTTSNPLRTALGPSYTGSSNEWRRERVDLSRFAGKTILLRFEYVTDVALNGPGWCVDDIAVDDIAIDAAGFFDDAESDSGWTARGFVRAGGRSVSQEFAVRLVEGDGDDATVTPLQPDADGRYNFRIDAPATLVVVPFAPKTAEQAAFTVEASAQ